MSEVFYEAMKCGLIREVPERKKKKKMSEYERSFTSKGYILEDHKTGLIQGGLFEKTVQELEIETSLNIDGILFKIWDIQKKDLLGHRIRYTKSAIENNEYPGPDGTTPKYRPSKDLGNVFFYPHLTSINLWKEIAKDITISVFITEGEKKAVLLCQYGYACIGLFGVNNWLKREKRKVKDKEGKEEEKEISVPIDCFDDIIWKDRIVYLVFDSDKYKNIQVLVAEAKLWMHLKDLGADARVINLPLDLEAKGIDDFFVKYAGNKNE